MIQRKCKRILGLNKNKDIDFIFNFDGYYHIYTFLRFKKNNVNINVTLIKAETIQHWNEFVYKKIKNESFDWREYNITIDFENAIIFDFYNDKKNLDLCNFIFIAWNNRNNINNRMEELNIHNYGHLLYNKPNYNSRYLIDKSSFNQLTEKGENKYVINNYYTTYGIQMDFELSYNNTKVKIMLNPFLIQISTKEVNWQTHNIEKNFDKLDELKNYLNTTNKLLFTHFNPDYGYILHNKYYNIYKQSLLKLEISDAIKDIIIDYCISKEILNIETTKYLGLKYLLECNVYYNDERFKQLYNTNIFEEFTKNITVACFDQY